MLTYACPGSATDLATPPDPLPEGRALGWSSGLLQEVSDALRVAGAEDLATRVGRWASEGVSLQVLATEALEEVVRGAPRGHLLEALTAASHDEQVVRAGRHLLGSLSQNADLLQLFAEGSPLAQAFEDTVGLADALMRDPASLGDLLQQGAQLAQKHHLPERARGAFEYYGRALGFDGAALGKLEEDLGAVVRGAVGADLGEDDLLNLTRLLDPEVMDHFLRSIDVTGASDALDQLLKDLGLPLSTQALEDSLDALPALLEEAFGEGLGWRGAADALQAAVRRSSLAQWAQADG